MKRSTLRGNDPDYILKLAEYVDSKMRVVAEETHTVDNFRLTVLGALNIADEYHLLKTKLESEERETSGEEVRLTQADGVRWRGRKPSRKRFIQEDRQRVREKRQQHHTRRGYEKKLLAIANGELVMTNKQYKAFIAFGRVRGWHRRPPGQRRKN